MLCGHDTKHSNGSRPALVPEALPNTSWAWLQSGAGEELQVPQTLQKGLRVHLPNLEKGESHKLNQSPQRALWSSVFHLEKPLGVVRITERKKKRKEKKKVSFETRSIERWLF